MKKDTAIENVTTPIQTPTRENSVWKPAYTYIAVGSALLVLFVSVFFQSIVNTASYVLDNVGQDFIFFMMAGFIAQMIDGALGMAYGVSASTFLMTLGVSPAAASASIHTSEIFTSGVSGLMHLRFRNVNKKLLKTLLLPGVIGAALGAYVLSSLEQYKDIIRPVIALYTLYLGVLIIRKALIGGRRRIKTKNIPRLAVFGGFMDSIGGGGWGPIVSSTLIAGGRHPRYTIGSVNLAEFFVALASSITFLAVIGLHHWQIIVGLILGGVIAAPIAAYLSKKLPIKAMLILVGVVVMAVSIVIIVRSLITG